MSLNTSKDLLITSELLYLLSHSSVFSFVIDFYSAVGFGKVSLTTSKDLRITNALLYQLSHISIFSFAIDFCSAVGFGRNAFPQKYSRSAHCRSHYSLFLHLILLVRFVHRTALWASPLTTSKDLRITNALLYQLSHISIFSFMIDFCSAVGFGKVILNYIQRPAHYECAALPAEPQ